MQGEDSRTSRKQEADFCTHTHTHSIGIDNVDRWQHEFRVSQTGAISERYVTLEISSLLIFFDFQRDAFRSFDSDRRYRGGKKEEKDILGRRRTQAVVMDSAPL